MTLAWCSDVSAAAWITTSELPWDQLVCFGPSDFPAYARLRFIPDPTYDGQSENDVHVDVDHPSEDALLRAALEVLSRHTRTPHDCYFCLWEGWGFDSRGDSRGRWSPPAFPPSVLQGPKVVVPNRAYFLFRGSWSDFGDWGTADSWRAWHGAPPPAFLWPADHAWCVANDVDPHWAGIGANPQAIDQLSADPRIDVVPADPHEEPPYYR